MGAPNHAKLGSDRGSSLAKLLAIPPAALGLYFDLTANEAGMSRTEILAEFSVSEGELDKLLQHLLNRGLVRQIQDETYEAVNPIEALAIILTNIRNSLQELRERFPGQLEGGLPIISGDYQQRIEGVSEKVAEIRAAIQEALTEAVQKFYIEASKLQSAQTFEGFADSLHESLVKEVEARMVEVRQRLGDFDSIDSFILVLNKLKIDVFDIVKISLSDMREKAFRLNELEEFRKTLVDLWNATPSVVGEHLTTFEQEMSTLEASLGDLFETTYRLGAFKGVIENFAREHIMTAVKSLKSGFQLSLTETIQDHLQRAQERFEKASVIAQQDFEQLKDQMANWVKTALDMAFNEVISRNQQAATDLAHTLEELTHSFREKFSKGLENTITTLKIQAHKLDGVLNDTISQLTQLQNNQIQPKIDRILKQTEQQLEQLANVLPKSFKQWRNAYLKSTQKQVENMFKQAEAQTSFALQGLNQVWRRSKETEPSTFDLYQFVLGQDDFQLQMTSMIARARNALLIIMPRGLQFKTQLLTAIAGNVRVRLVVADPFESSNTQKLLKKTKDHGNVQLRQDPRGDMWGVLRDFEEILIGNTGQGAANIVGIISSHEDHIELLRSLMETRWLQARLPSP